MNEGKSASTYVDFQSIFVQTIALEQELTNKGVDMRYRLLQYLIELFLGRERERERRFVTVGGFSLVWGK